MYSVVLGRKPNKFYESLDPKTRERLRSLFEALGTNPWPARDFDLTKIRAENDCFRIRIGNYRVCYHIDAERNEILIYKLERKSETTYS